MDEPRRSENLQVLANALQQALGLSEEFVAACDHPYWCRCDLCLAWWSKTGHDDGAFGPFSPEEIAKHLGITLEELWERFPTDDDSEWTEDDATEAAEDAWRRGEREVLDNDEDDPWRYDLDDDEEEWL